MNVLLGSVAQTVLADCRPRCADPAGATQARFAARGSRLPTQRAQPAPAVALDHRRSSARVHAALAHVVDEVPVQVRTALANLPSTTFTPEGRAAGKL